jgi:hypothetical protein
VVDEYRWRFQTLLRKRLSNSFDFEPNWFEDIDGASRRFDRCAVSASAWRGMTICSLRRITTHRD